jgi:hypothetical protein
MARARRDPNAKRLAPTGPSRSRANFYLPDQVRADLAAAAAELGVSASLYLERLITHDLEHRQVLDQLAREFPRDEELPVSA